MIKKLVIFSTAFIVGCTGATRIDDQEGQSGQGKDQFKGTWCESVTPDKDRYLCEVLVDIGRDKDNVVVTIKIPSGKDQPPIEMTYMAVNASGLQQAIVRSEIEKELLKVQGKITLEVIQRILDGAFVSKP